MPVTNVQLFAVLFVAVFLTVFAAKTWFEQCKHQEQPTYVSSNETLTRSKPKALLAPMPTTIMSSNIRRLPMYHNQDLSYLKEGYTSQVGTISCQGRILPLFQTELISRRWRYLYHTLTDSNLPMKVSVYSKGRDCLDNQLGCDEVYSGEQVQVPSLGADDWEVYLYKR